MMVSGTILQFDCLCICELLNIGGYHVTSEAAMGRKEYVNAVYLFALALECFRMLRRHLAGGNSTSCCLWYLRLNPGPCTWQVITESTKLYPQPKAPVSFQGLLHCRTSFPSGVPGGEPYNSIVPTVPHWEIVSASWFVCLFVFLPPELSRPQYQSSKE